MSSSSANGSAPGNEFVVLINHEEQYAIWPAGKPVPDKWRSADVTGSREQCLDYIRNAWSDMRPLSVRQHDRADKPPDQSS